MAQNENYSQVDLRVGTEEQFNAKVGTLPAGALFGVTDSTVSKADLSTDLKNEINGKINKPANPTSDSAVVINSSGTVSTKPLTSITGKSEVYVGSTTPTNEDEILWINPDGTSGGGGSSGGKLYRHTFSISNSNTIAGGYNIIAIGYSSSKTPITFTPSESSQTIPNEILQAFGKIVTPDGIYGQGFSSAGSPVGIHNISNEFYVEGVTNDYGTALVVNSPKLTFDFMSDTVKEL